MRVPKPKGVGGWQIGAEGAISHRLCPRFHLGKPEAGLTALQREKLGNPHLPPPFLEQHRGQLPSPKSGGEVPILTMGEPQGTPL